MGATCLKTRSTPFIWGVLWNRKKVEITWDDIDSAALAMVHKKYLIRYPLLGVVADIGSDEKVAKISLNEKKQATLLRHVEAIKNKWWDAYIEVNKAGDEVYLREEPVGGYEALLARITGNLQ